MAEILKVVASFLLPAIELGKFIAKPIKHQFNYLCCFKNNIQSLRDEAKKLEEARASLQMRVTTEENNAREIIPQVMAWLENVGEIQVKMSTMETEITNIPNSGFTVKTRFSLSKKAKITAETMKELQESCNFSTLSQPPPPAALVSIPLDSLYTAFESRKHIEEKIMTSLRDNEANMLAICGMGGIGKTTMAKRVMHRVRENLGFEEIVMVVVSQNVDMLRIQDDIAKSLGLNLGEGSLSSKAHTLRTRLTGRKRSLIVLDDVWEHLKLEDLGIPCESGCKILFTSRDSNIFKRMYVDRVYALGFLSEIEAWHLFKSNAGSCIDHQNVISIAHQVVEECKGLPIALVTVGVALKDVRNTSVWEDALQQLRISYPIDMPEVLDDVYKPLRFSYELLKSVRAKSLFLLCCLYPEDHDIPLEELAMYAMGLHMFEEITSLEQGRNRVCVLVGMLKSRFLLLDGHNNNHVKMHDVVRDVAIFIASDEKRISCNDCTWISPFIGETIELITRGSSFPNLSLLLTRHQPRDKEWEMYDGFFEGMRELKVFSITCPSLGRLPHTIELLKNLRTMILVSCRSLKSISIFGELVNLEILICRGCDSIESLPVEMGRLSGLKLLELSSCWNLKTIVPGIISNLIGLEELIVEGFDKWEVDTKGNEGQNVGVSELQALSRLTRLEIQIKDSRVAAEPIRLSSNMVKYDIIIGGRRDYDHDPAHVLQCSLESMGLEKKLELKLPADNITLGNWIHKCVRSVEYMSLDGNGSRNIDLQLARNMRWLIFRQCSTVKKLVINMTTTSTSTTATLFPLLEVMWLEKLSELEEICDIDSFNNLKRLRLESLPALKHLWKTSNDGSYQHINVVSTFSNLSSLYISGCDRLRSFFSSSMRASGCLLQLERLEIQSCKMMEQVFLWNIDQEGNQRYVIDITLVFPKLQFLSLSRMPRLTSFCRGIQRIEFPLLAQMRIISCPLLKSFVSTTSGSTSPDDDAKHLFCKLDKVGFCCLQELFIGDDDKMRRNWCPQIPKDLFAGLCELRVWRCKGMTSLFSYSIARNLLNVRIIEIKECEEMVEVIEDEDEDREEDACSSVIRLLPNLEELYLYDLCKLKSFCGGRCALELPSLKQLYIRDCDLMDEFRSAPLNTPNLETLKIDYYDFFSKNVNSALQQHRLGRGT